MTATRPWVKWGARWLARIDLTSGIARLALLGITGVSTLGSMLRDYGLGGYYGPIIFVGSVGYVVFSYKYAEEGVSNQVNRDQSDMRQNHATPFQFISNFQTACAFYAGQKGRELTESEREAIWNEMIHNFSRLRDGMDLEKELAKENR